MARFNVKMTNVFGPVAPLVLGLLESCNSDSYRNTFVAVPQIEDDNTHLDVDSVHLDKDTTTSYSRIENDFRSLLANINEIRSFSVYTNTQRALKNPRLTTTPSLMLDRFLYESSMTTNFDAFAFHKITSGAPLYVLSMHLLRIHGFIASPNTSITVNSTSLSETGPTKGLGVFPLDKLSRFFAEIEASYLPFSYHNQKHAVDVLQLAHVIFTSDRMRLHGLPDFLSSSIRHATRYKAILEQLENVSSASSSQCFGFTRLELLALLISAAIHDVGHVGTNNSFQAKTSSPLSILYNDQNVLENNHLATAFAILKKPECDFMSYLIEPERAQLRSMIIQLVLATDLADHRRHMDAAKEVVSKLTTTYEQSNIYEPDTESRLSLLKMVLKCSDVGHPARSIAVHTLWSDSIQNEFFNQGDQERALGYEVTGPLNRFGDSLPKSQIGFINFLVKPIYSIINSPIVTKSLIMSKQKALLNDPHEIYADMQEDNGGNIEIMTPWMYNLEANLKHWKILDAESAMKQ